MKDFNLNRIQALEIQNQFNDAKSDKLSNQINFDKALANVQNNIFESQLKVDEIKKSKFVVVFDLDDTLYDQYMNPNNKCTDFNYNYTSRGKLKTKQIFMAQKWGELFAMIKKNGGSISVKWMEQAGLKKSEAINKIRESLIQKSKFAQNRL